MRRTEQPVPPSYFDKTATRQARGKTRRKSQRKQAPSPRQPCSLRRQECKSDRVEEWKSLVVSPTLPLFPSSTLRIPGRQGGITDHSGFIGQASEPRGRTGQTTPVMRRPCRQRNSKRPDDIPRNLRPLAKVPIHGIALVLVLVIGT